MKIVNLQPFWTVQECSGGVTHIFSSQEAAEVAIARWNAELDERFERWEAGDHSVPDSLVQSTIEPDLEGGCYISYHVHPAWRPSGWLKWLEYSQEFADWQENIGVDSIHWGNPATARPSKR